MLKKRYFNLETKHLLQQLWGAKAGSAVTEYGCNSDFNLKVANNNLPCATSFSEYKNFI